MIEPEEIIEAQLVAAVSAQSPGIQVLGALSPVDEEMEKLSDNSSISVFADVASQSFDSNVPNVPFTFSARIAVRYANADDSSGSGFRSVCRAVRAAIAALLGDGCTALSADGFTCDGVILEGTSTAADTDSQNGGMIKVYNLSVTGRYTEPPTTTTIGDQTNG